MTVKLFNSYNSIHFRKVYRWLNKEKSLSSTVFHKVFTNSELLKIKSLLLGEIVWFLWAYSQFLPTDQYIILLCIKIPYLLYITDSLHSDIF